MMPRTRLLLVYHTTPRFATPCYRLVGFRDAGPQVSFSPLCGPSSLFTQLPVRNELGSPRSPGPTPMSVPG
jgi:hypothetical protein